MRPWVQPQHRQNIFSKRSQHTMWPGVPYSILGVYTNNEILVTHLSLKVWNCVTSWNQSASMIPQNHTVGQINESLTYSLQTFYSHCPKIATLNPFYMIPLRSHETVSWFPQHAQVHLGLQCRALRSPELSFAELHADQCGVHLISYFPETNTRFTTLPSMACDLCGWAWMQKGLHRQNFKRTRVGPGATFKYWDSYRLTCK
jgi:hypothetical protein